MTNKLVAYFSASGVTKEVAQNLAKAAEADIFEIEPKEPYTEAALNWMDKKSRSSVEMNDKNCRPEIVEKDLDMDNYDTVFLGFPIWWYVAPNIVNTFLETYDFSNKTIVLFATSGGSGFGGTAEYLKPSLPDSATIVEGELFNYNPSVEDLEEWVKDLKL